jgi:hypothetical protein
MIPRWALIGLGVAAVAGAAWYVAKRKQANDAQAKAERLASPAMIKAALAGSAQRYRRATTSPDDFRPENVRQSALIGLRGGFETQLANRLAQ